MSTLEANRAGAGTNRLRSHPLRNCKRPSKRQEEDDLKGPGVRLKGSARSKSRRKRSKRNSQLTRFLRGYVHFLLHTERPMTHFVEAACVLGAHKRPKTRMILGADNSPDGARGWASINAAAKPNTYTGNGGVSQGDYPEISKLIGSLILCLYSASAHIAENCSRKSL